MSKKSKKTKKSGNNFNVKAIVTSKGFYIALLTLIMVVGTVTVVQKFTTGIETASSSFDEEAWESAVADAAIEMNIPDEADAAAEITEDIPVQEVFQPPKESFPEISQQETITTAANMSDENIVAELNMISPCNGEISRQHSPDKPVYFTATQDWRTHSGIDILSKEGTIVMAAADGVIEKVYEDKKLGIVVIVGHAENIKTLYANLQDLEFIEIGRKVAKGDTIGAIGTSSLIEKKDEPHLHFEVIRGEKSENPSEYLSF